VNVGEHVTMFRRSTLAKSNVWRPQLLRAAALDDSFPRLKPTVQSLVQTTVQSLVQTTVQSLVERTLGELSPHPLLDEAVEVQ
jgi:hypothetical protein